MTATLTYTKTFADGCLSGISVPAEIDSLPIPVAVAACQHMRQQERAGTLLSDYTGNYRISQVGVRVNEPRDIELEADALEPLN